MALGKGIPVINGFDLNSKLPLDSRAVVDTMEEMNALVTGGSVGDGQLCYCKANKKLYVLKDNVWSEVGGGIPVIEGTLNEEESTENTKYYTIPETQTSPFIFHSSDIGYVFIDVLGESYSGIISANSYTWALFNGSETTLSFSLYSPASFYNINFSGNFPQDEISSVDVTFPLTDRYTNSICLVTDIDVTRVFLKDGNSIFGSFQTPIIHCNDGKYRYWSMDAKEGDTTNTLVTIKCKVVNLDGGSTSPTTIVKNVVDNKVTITKEEFDKLASGNYDLIVINNTNGLFDRYFCNNVNAATLSEGKPDTISAYCSLITHPSTRYVQSGISLSFSKNNLTSDLNETLGVMNESKLFNKKIMTYGSFDAEDILPCTTADNGKVLSVVNGEAQWASVGGSGSISVTFED